MPILVFTSVGQERSEFWSLLGGELPYIKERETKSAGKDDFMPRLFHGSNASGSFKSKAMHSVHFFENLIIFFKLSKFFQQNWCQSGLIGR